MVRLPDILYAVGALCGLALGLSGLHGVYGFITDLIAGTTTTGYPADAPEVVERATNAGRYWVLMSAWLRDIFFGSFAFVVCGRAWRARRAVRRDQ